MPKSPKSTTDPRTVFLPPVEGINPQQFAGHQGDRMAHDVVHRILAEAGLGNVGGGQDVAHADA